MSLVPNHLLRLHKVCSIAICVKASHKVPSACMVMAHHCSTTVNAVTMHVSQHEQCKDSTQYSLSSAALCSCPQRSVECAVHVECAEVARHATGSPFLSQPALCQFLLETRANTNPFPFTVTSLMATTADTSRKQLTCTRTLAHTLAHTHQTHYTGATQGTKTTTGSTDRSRGPKDDKLG